jgi:hypothetical protein
VEELVLAFLLAPTARLRDSSSCQVSSSMNKSWSGSCSRCYNCYICDLWLYLLRLVLFLLMLLLLPQAGAQVLAVMCAVT